MAETDDPLICFRAGEAEDFLGVVNEGVALSGTWTWNGTTTVLTTDTSGVAVGSEIRLRDGCEFLVIQSIAANVSVVVDNPNKTTIPTGLGAQLKTPLDLSLAVDGTPARPAILIFVWRRGNARVFKKTTYNQEEIQLLDQTSNPGQYLLRIDDPDTDKAKFGAIYRYELAVARQDFLRNGAQSGTAATLAATNAITGIGTTFTQAKPGDIVHVTSGANTGLATRIISIADDLNLVGERTWAISDPAATFEIRRSKILTATAGPGQIDPSEVKIEL